MNWLVSIIRKRKCLEETLTQHRHVPAKLGAHATHFEGWLSPRSPRSTDEHYSADAADASRFATTL